MSLYFPKILDQLKNVSCLNPPVDHKELASLAEKGLDCSELLDFYRYADGGLIGEGCNFRGSNGGWYWGRFANCASLRRASTSPYVSPGAARSVEDFWILIEYGDGNFIGVSCSNGLTLTDFFHENAGMPGTGLVIEKSLEDLFSNLLVESSAYWLDRAQDRREYCF